MVLQEVNESRMRARPDYSEEDCQLAGWFSLTRVKDSANKKSRVASIDPYMFYNIYT